MIAHAPNSNHGSFAIAFSYCLPVNISDSLETLCLYSLKCHTINGLTNIRARKSGHNEYEGEQDKRDVLNYDA